MAAGEQSGDSNLVDLTAASGLGLTKCLPQMLQGDIEINRSLAGACGDDEPLAGPPLWPADAGEQPRLCRDRHLDTCFGLWRNDLDLERGRQRSRMACPRPTRTKSTPTCCVPTTQPSGASVKDSRAQGPGAQAIGAAVSRDAGRGHVDFHCPWGSGGQALSRVSRPCGLSVHISIEGFGCIFLVGPSINLSNSARGGNRESPFRKGLTVGGCHERDFETQILDSRSIVLGGSQLDSWGVASKACIGSSVGLSPGR